MCNSQLMKNSLFLCRNQNKCAEMLIFVQELEFLCRIAVCTKIKVRCGFVQNNPALTKLVTPPKLSEDLRGRALTIKEVRCILAGSDT